MEYGPDLQKPGKWKSAWAVGLVFAGILLSLSCAYLPALQSYYVHHDDYLLWLWDRQGVNSHPAAHFIRKVCGRPLAPVLLCLQGWMVETVADANAARFVTVVVLATLGFLTYWWLCRNNIAKLHAFLFAIAAFTLPAFQSDVGTIANGQQAMACLIAFIGTILAWRASQRIHGLRRTRKTLLPFLALTVLAGGVICAPFLIYQPAGMLYWPLLAIVLLSGGPMPRNRRVARWAYLAGLHVLVMGGYFLWAHFATKRGVTYAVILTSDYLRKAQWFLREPLTNVLNFWKLWPSRTLAISTAVVIGLGLLADFVRTIHKNWRDPAPMGLWAATVLKYLLVVLIIPLCFLPNLAAHADHSAYRTLTVLSLYMIFLLFWAVVSLCRIVPEPYRNKVIVGVLIAGCLVGGWTAHDNILNYYVIPQTTELRYIKARIAQAGPDAFDKILVIKPHPIPYYSFIAPASRYDEFGTPAVGFAQDIPQIVVCAIRELNRERPGEKPFKEVHAESCLIEEFKGRDDRTLVIDMTRFHRFY